MSSSQPPEPSRPRIPFSLRTAPGAVVETIKIAEDGGAIIVRLYESEGARGPLSSRRLCRCERHGSPACSRGKKNRLRLRTGAFELDLRPFEIVTL